MFGIARPYAELIHHFTLWQTRVTYLAGNPLTTHVNVLGVVAAVAYHQVRTNVCRKLGYACASCTFHSIYLYLSNVFFQYTPYLTIIQCGKPSLRNSIFLSSTNVPIRIK